MKLTARVVRELEISLWRNLAVEEIYEIKNGGAILDGGFSRIDYERRQGKGNADFSKNNFFLKEN